MADPAPQAHGGIDPDELSALGLDPAEVVDFSVNVNAYGPAPEMREAIRGAPLELYPDPRARRGRRAIAASCGVSADEVALGNGAAELLWTLARVLLRPGDAALVLEPTFSEFRLAAAAAGARLFERRASEAEGFLPDLEAAAVAARAHGVRAVYLCNPNNPTGVALPPDAVAAFARALPDATIVLDEAFLSLSERWADRAAPLPANVVRVRSLTKEHAIPGLRVGYLLGPAPLVARIDAGRPAWTVSAAAERAAEAAPALEGFVAASRERLLADRRRLAERLRGLGLSPRPTSTTYLLVEVGDAGALRRRLLAAGVLVRDCASFGLPRFLRLGARPAAEEARLLSGLRAALPTA